MLGYEDPYGGTAGNSVGNPDGAVYYSDVKVVRLSPPTITSVSTGASSVTFTFQSTDGDDTPGVLHRGQLIDGHRALHAGQSACHHHGTSEWRFHRGRAAGGFHAVLRSAA